MLGLLVWCSGCGSMSTSQPPPGPPVDVNLTLAMAVTDADGTPLDALVTVTVYEGLGANPDIYQWHTSTSPEEQTIGCVAGDPDEEVTWEFNGFWAERDQDGIPPQARGLDCFLRVGEGLGVLRDMVDTANAGSDAVVSSDDNMNAAGTFPLIPSSNTVTERLFRR